MLAAAAASSSGFVLAPAFVDADGNVTREYGSLAAMQRDALRWTLPRDPEDDGGLGGRGGRLVLGARRRERRGAAGAAELRAARLGAPRRDRAAVQRAG